MERGERASVASGDINALNYDGGYNIMWSTLSLFRGFVYV